MRRTIFWLLSLTLLLAVTSPYTLAQAQVRVVVDRDFVNIRRVPALGAEVVGSANVRTVFIVDAISTDSEWYRIRFAGNEAWVSVAVVTVLEGNVAALPVRDPRFIPFGGPEAPRAGFTEQTSDIIGRLADSGLRVRTGPGVAYREIANAPRFAALPLLGRSADSQWVQVNFDGILGWVTAEFVTILGGRTITELPVGGIVADAPPLEDTDQNDLFGTLRFLRERIDLAQPSLDTQRQVWTSAALGVVPPCGGYPPRPSNANIPTDLRARYGDTLEPLLRDFNRAMENVRNAIDLQVEVCSRGGSDVVLISVPVVSGGLEFVDDADILFVSLRRRIDELLPEIGPNDCIFEFAGRVDVLPLFPQLAVIEDRFTEDDLAIGYCFDASPLNIGYLEVATFGTNYDTIIAISPLGNPTDFLSTASISASLTPSGTILNPIEFPFEGRYLLLLSADTEPGVVPTGQYALTLLDVALVQPSGALITYEADGTLVRNVVPVTLADGTVVGGQIVGDVGEGSTVTNNSGVAINVFLDPDETSAVVGQLQAGETVPAIGLAEGFGFIQVALSDGVTGFVQESAVTFINAQTTVTDGTVACPGVFLTCNDLLSCAEVQACVDAGSTLLDTNGNGIACDADESALACQIAAPLN
ncbi:MAG: SH3 domain-containing protein [Chloroflexota bacterium]